jgi:hypothetical protein
MLIAGFMKTGRTQYNFTGSTLLPHENKWNTKICERKRPAVG